MDTHLEQTGQMSEADACAEIGISREAMAEMRGGSENGILVEGTHWVREKRHVLLTREGLEILKKKIGAEGAGALGNGQHGAFALGDGAILLVVTSVPKMNRRILCAVKKEGGAAVRVRVRDNQNFMPGMEFRARPDGAYADIYILEGRGPRYRGRW
jgi:hypothetical protein